MPTSIVVRLQGWPPHVTTVSWLWDQYAPDITDVHPLAIITVSSLYTLPSIADQVPLVSSASQQSDRIDQDCCIWPPVGGAIIDCGGARSLRLSVRAKSCCCSLETGCANKATSSRLLSDSTDLHVGSWCTTRHDLRNITVSWGGCFEIHSLNTMSKHFCSTHLLHSFSATWSRVPPKRLGRPFCRINSQSSFMQCSFGFSILQIFPPLGWPNVKRADPDFFLWGFVEFLNLITLWCLWRRPK